MLKQPIYQPTNQPFVREAAPKRIFKREGKLEINPLLLQAFGITPEELGDVIKSAEEPEAMRDMFAFLSDYATLSESRTRLSISGDKLDFLVADLKRRMGIVAEVYSRQAIEYSRLSGFMEHVKVPKLQVSDRLQRISEEARKLSAFSGQTREDKVAFIDAVVGLEHTSGSVIPIAFGITDYGREDYWPKKLLAFLRSQPGMVREGTAPCWEKYLYQEKADPKKLDLSGSFTRKRYTGIVNPNVEILDIATVLARADINYTPEEYPAEQPYIDNRLIPHMRTTKLPFPVIEIYTRDAVDNQRPHLSSGKRPFTDIHIIDGAHRIVALKKMGINEIPFIVYREPGGNLMVKEGTTPAPEPADKEFRANPNLINRELAMRSHSGTSWDPEKRGEQEISEFASYVQEVYERLKKAAKTDKQKEYLSTEMARFQSTFAGKYNDLLSSKGSCLSTMIAGPSKFPTGRAQKACSAADKRYEELIEFRDRAEAAILRELKKMAVEEAGGELEVLKKKVADAIRNHEFMVKTNAIVRKKIPDEQKIKDIQAIAPISEITVRKILTPDYMGRIGFPAYALSNDTANIHRMEERVKELERKEATPSADIKFEGGSIKDNATEDRVQIFFDKKPEQAMIDKLKGEGWRWSPSNSAWQRKRTDQAIWSAERILGIKITRERFVPVKIDPARALYEAIQREKGETAGVKTANFISIIHKLDNLPLRQQEVNRAKLLLSSLPNLTLEELIALEKTVKQWGVTIPQIKDEIEAIYKEYLELRKSERGQFVSTAPDKLVTIIEKEYDKPVIPKQGAAPPITPPIITAPQPQALIELRWVYGTQDQKWHLVGYADRDYAHGITQERMKIIGPDAARAEYLSPAFTQVIAPIVGYIDHLKKGDKVSWESPTMRGTFIDGYFVGYNADGTVDVEHRLAGFAPYKYTVERSKLKAVPVQQPSPEESTDLNKLILIIEKYVTEGTTYEDFSTGRTFLYLSKSGVKLDPNNIPSKLKDDLKKAGYNSLSELWNDTSRKLRMKMYVPPKQPQRLLTAPVPPEVKKYTTPRTFKKGTIARNNITNEKFVLETDVEALQEDKNAMIWRTNDQYGHYIYLDDQRPAAIPAVKKPGEISSDDMQLLKSYEKITDYDINKRITLNQGKLKVLAARKLPRIEKGKYGTMGSAYIEQERLGISQEISRLYRIQELRELIATQARPEPWKLTQEEYWRAGAGGKAFEGRGSSDYNHELAVKKALSEHKPVPSEVQRELIKNALEKVARTPRVYGEEYVQAKLRKENEEILAKIRAEREQIRAAERAEENELNAELNKLPPALKRHAETEIYGTLHMPETHKDYRNRFYIALGKVRIAFAHLPGGKEPQPPVQPQVLPEVRKEEPVEPLSPEYDRVLKAYLEKRGHELTLQEFIWADKYTIRGTAKYAIRTMEEKRRREEFILKNYDENTGKKFHRGTVISALQRGLKVPDIVLKDYPDLMKKEVPEPTDYFTLKKAQELSRENKLKLSDEQLREKSIQVRDYIRLIEGTDEYSRKTLIKGGYYAGVIHPDVTGIVPVDICLLQNLKFTLGEFDKERERRKQEKIKISVPTVPAAKPVQSIQDIKQQVINSIQEAKSMDELKQILKGLGFLPLPESEKRQLIDLYQIRLSELMGGLKFGERIPEEEKKKRRAPQKAPYAPPSRRLEEFGIKEAMRRGYGYA